MRSIDPAELTAEQRRLLLTIARQAVAEALGLGPAVGHDEGWLHEPCASFVTLNREGLLRGCVGMMRPAGTLVEDLRRNAVAAALDDPRFPPLTREELADVGFEVSLLSPLEPLRVRGEEELLRCLEPGVHGLLLEWGPHRGTFLPQMWEQLPDPAQFVAHLKHKAGLPPDFWADDIALWTFTVRAFDE